MSTLEDAGTSGFRREREGLWREDEKMLARVEKVGASALDAQETLRLPQLYRNALSSLAVARATSLDRNLLAYLEALSARAFLVVHGSKTSLLAALLEFARSGFPRALRAARVELAIAALLLVAGTIAGAALVLGDPERFHSLVDPSLAGGRGPDASADELRSPLYAGAEHEAEELGLFAGFLFGHNAQIGLLAFALGFLAGVPVFVLMLANGLMLGAFHAVYQRAGISLELWAWLLPHGVTELLGVAIGGAAGLLVARGLLFPGTHTRRASLERHGRHAATLAGGAVLLFFCAALIEGIFRQRVQDLNVRWTVACATAAFWALYFGFAGRGPRASSSREIEP